MNLDIPNFLKRKFSPKKPISANLEILVLGENWLPRFKAAPPNPNLEPMYATVPDEEKVKSTLNVQDYIREKTSNMIAELEGMIDDGIITPSWSIYNWLQANDVSSMIAKKIGEHFEPIANELKAVIDKKLPLEGYEKYSKKKLNEIYAIYSILTIDALKYATVAKKIKIPRKKKPMKIEKILKTFQFLSASDEYKIASVDPAKIIGSQELWTFNVKNKMLTVYRARDRGGLSVKGTSIIQWDEKTSVAKLIGRKTEEKVKTILEGGKVVLRKFMDELLMEKSEPTRINKHTILLRIL